jgi:hypothetical protein
MSVKNNTKSSTVMYMCVMDVDFVSFSTIRTTLLEQIWRCDLFWWCDLFWRCDLFCFFHFIIHPRFFYMLVKCRASHISCGHCCCWEGWTIYTRVIVPFFHKERTITLVEILLNNNNGHKIYVRLGILLACRKNVDDRIVSFKGMGWSHKTSLTLTIFF